MVQVGDRVVSCFDIACGGCGSCKRGLFTSCDTTNPSEAMEAMYGDRSAGKNLCYLDGEWGKHSVAREAVCGEAVTVVQWICKSVQFISNLICVCVCVGFFGYSHLTGGYEGGQADYVRVPFGTTSPHYIR